jgi:hypothetical protein
MSIVHATTAAEYVAREETPNLYVISAHEEDPEIGYPKQPTLAGQRMLD